MFENQKIIEELEKNIGIGLEENKNFIKNICLLDKETQIELMNLLDQQYNYKNISDVTQERIDKLCKSTWLQLHKAEAIYKLKRKFSNLTPIKVKLLSLKKIKELFTLKHKEANFYYKYIHDNKTSETFYLPLGRYEDGHCFCDKNIGVNCDTIDSYSTIYLIVYKTYSKIIFNYAKDTNNKPTVASTKLKFGCSKIEFEQELINMLKQLNELQPFFEFNFNDTEYDNDVLNNLGSELLYYQTIRYYPKIRSDEFINIGIKTIFDNKEHFKTIKDDEKTFLHFCKTKKINQNDLDFHLKAFFEHNESLYVRLGKENISRINKTLESTMQDIFSDYVSI